MTDRLEPLIAYHPFSRLNALLADVKPGGPPVALHVGEPQRGESGAEIPAFLAEAIAANAAGWGKYPPTDGTPAFRAAVAGWLERRYAVAPGLIDPDRHVLPAAGTREALFRIALAAIDMTGKGARPLVLMPNPFYHVYAGAAAIAGAEIHFVDAGPRTQFLPDYAGLDPAVLDATALVYLASPANPQGSVASLSYLETLIELSRRHRFTIAFDECYSEIHDGDPPPGALSALTRLGGGLEGIIVFNSLSKRSGTPGLRSGFTLADERLSRRMLQLVNYGGAAVPLPILAASAALWSDEAHVLGANARYRANFDLAGRILGNRFGFYRPKGGFFLWLDVGDGEAAARRLWAEAGLRVLPGAYMARAESAGKNPAQAYIRLALVHAPEKTEKALVRLVEVLGERDAGASPTPARERRA